MRNRTRNRRLRVGLALLGAGLLGVACGSGGSQTDGLVLNATGIWRGAETISGTTITCVEVGVSNAIVDNSYTLYLNRVNAFPERTNPLADPCGGYLGVENNLVELGMNVRAIDVRYEVVGSDIEIPSNQIATGFQIPSSSSTVATTSGQPNLVYAEMVAQFVPATVLNFLRERELQLPAMPYQMKAYARATGRSEAGKQYRSNEVGYTFTVDQWFLED